MPDIDARTQRRIPGKSLAFAALREWDRRTAKNVDFFAANSTAVRDRIHECYGRESEVIHPPVDTDYYDLPQAAPGAHPGPGRLPLRPLQERRPGDRSLRGGGSAAHRRRQGPPGGRSCARSPPRLGADAEFEISPPDERLRELYRSSLAVVFPANEDFGIIPVEAQACGAPVVALDVGGARDTVVQGETGLRVARQEPASVRRGDPRSGRGAARRPPSAAPTPRASRWSAS